jgi:deoxyribodipyrimidine photo-lyase
MPQKVAVCWFRRDLRLNDNAALHHALSSGFPVLPLFIFDSTILGELEEKRDRRVAFIHHALEQLQKQLLALGSTLDVRHGEVKDCWQQLMRDYEIAGVFVNHDYEPYAALRDVQVAALLGTIPFRTFKDQVIFERSEIVKDDGKPYTVFTPYSRKWKAALSSALLEPYDCSAGAGRFLQQPERPIPTLKAIGFERVDHPLLQRGNEDIIASYDKTRDIPSIAGTTRLGIHLRFGTISIRQLVRTALRLNATFLGELIWREFFMQLLWHEPRVVQEPYKRQYAALPWRNQEDEFKKWCEGRTGYPLVDAGMRELNETGFMHNRVRMVTASFLVKHLLIDWKWGEAYFAARLLDFELASNNGNWQWAAGCGCDAAPYFRIFNPAAQAKRFDPSGAYIRKWVPEVAELSYPQPMVVHEQARERCLHVFKTALNAPGGTVQAGGR